MPAHLILWFASRSLGIVAMLTLAISVALGLMMAGRLASRPGLMPKLRRVHEAMTLVTLGLIAGHGGLLLFDSYLHPGLAGLTIPFAMSYRPLFTGLGIIAGWGAVILGLSFYVRKRIGAKLWRKLHRLMIVVYLLALTHTVGAGSNGLSPWMLWMLSALTAPVVFAFVLRIFGARAPRRPAQPIGSSVRTPALAA